MRGKNLTLLQQTTIKTRGVQQSALRKERGRTRAKLSQLLRRCLQISPPFGTIAVLLGVPLLPAGDKISIVLLFITQTRQLRKCGSHEVAALLSLSE